VSLITGTEWEAAVGRYLGEIEGWAATKQQPPGNHRGRGVTFSDAGPADFALLRGSVRVAIEVKAHTEQAHKRWPLRNIKPAQAADMDKATHAAVLLRFAGHGDADLGVMARDSADFVFSLDWCQLGPMWHEQHDANQWAGLSPRDCLVMARESGPGCWAMHYDAHGDWRCPDLFPGLASAWGLNQQERR